MELGLLLAGGGGTSVADMATLATRAESSGYDGIFVPESWRSGVATTAAMAAATERARVGPYVLNAHARTPLSAGMDAVDLDQLSGGRLVLGVGSGNEVMNEKGHGVPVSRPLAKMRDYVEVLRRVTRAAAGTRVSYRGERHTVAGWRPQAVPARAAIPILLAATSRRMTALAADSADGIALGALQSVEFVSGIAAECRSVSPLGAGFRVFCAAFVAVDPDRELARTAARRSVVDLFAVKPHPHYERLLHAQGYGDFAHDVLGRIKKAGRHRAEMHVPDEVVDTLTIAGTPADCAARIGQYATSVDMLVLSNVAAMEQLTPEAVVDRTRLVESYDRLLHLPEARTALAGSADTELI